MKNTKKSPLDPQSEQIYRKVMAGKYEFQKGMTFEINGIKLLLFAIFLVFLCQVVTYFIN
jgi:hypothetical protein